MSEELKIKSNEVECPNCGAIMGGMKKYLRGLSTSEWNMVCEGCEHELDVFLNADGTLYAKESS